MPRLGDRIPPIDRILARVDLSFLVPEICVLWPGSLSQGYGKISSPTGPLWVHRVLYEHFIGPIPEGHHLDHTCHNEAVDCPGGSTCPHRACLNWRYHFEIKMPRENTDAADQPRQRGLFATHCANGHPWAENERWIIRGTRGGGKAGKRERYCAACNRERGR